MGDRGEVNLTPLPGMPAHISALFGGPGFLLALGTSCCNFKHKSWSARGTSFVSMLNHDSRSWGEWGKARHGFNRSELFRLAQSFRKAVYTNSHTASPNTCGLAAEAQSSVRPLPTVRLLPQMAHTSAAFPWRTEVGFIWAPWRILFDQNRSQVDHFAYMHSN